VTRSIYVPPWRIDLDRRPGVERVAADRVLVRAIGNALHRAGAPAPASVGLILCDDREIAGLNATHLGTSGPTDVLSFPLLPAAAYPDHPGKEAARPAQAFPLPPGGRPHLGDVVVSVERAIDQALTGRGGQTGDVRWSPADELRLLVTHGVLHLCGWDHAERVEESAMRALERSLIDH
jgi:probable rRNA maturation factor